MVSYILRKFPNAVGKKNESGPPAAARFLDTEDVWYVNSCLDCLELYDINVGNGTRSPFLWALGCSKYSDVESPYAKRPLRSNAVMMLQVLAAVVERAFPVGVILTRRERMRNSSYMR